MSAGPTVWYRVRDLDAGRRFYRDVLEFEEVAVDFNKRWTHLRRGAMEVGRRADMTHVATVQGGRRLRDASAIK